MGFSALPSFVAFPSTTLSRNWPWWTLILLSRGTVVKGGRMQSRSLLTVRCLFYLLLPKYHLGTEMNLQQLPVICGATSPFSVLSAAHKLGFCR